MKSKEEIFGQYFKPAKQGSMSDKDIDRIYSCMMEYAQQFQQPVKDVSVQLLKEVCRFYKGEGEYGFWKLADEQERGDASFDAWQGLYARIENFLRQYESTEPVKKIIDKLKVTTNQDYEKNYLQSPSNEQPITTNEVEELTKAFADKLETESGISQMSAKELILAEDCFRRGARAMFLHDAQIFADHYRERHERDRKEIESLKAKFAGKDRDFYHQKILELESENEKLRQEIEELRRTTAQ